jgi:DNA-directed RNA polymerase alpha subunit
VKLAKIKNLGQKSVKETGSALHALGYIEDMDSW